MSYFQLTEMCLIYRFIKQTLSKTRSLSHSISFVPSLFLSLSLSRTSLERMFVLVWMSHRHRHTKPASCAKP